MFQANYFVPKSTGTLADSLVAYGVTTVLAQVILVNRGSQRASEVRVEDAGPMYVAALPEPLHEEWLTTKLPLDMAWAVFRKKELPEGVPFLDYNAIWTEINTERAQREAQRMGKLASPSRSLDGHAALEQMVESTHTQQHRDVGLLIGDYRMQGEATHNKAVQQWYETVEAGYQAANLRAILRMFTTPQVDVEQVAKEWAQDVKVRGIDLKLTATQAYNPSAGKGYVRSKDDKLSTGNIDAFWLLEYLKAVAIFVAASPRAFKGEEMRKTYVVAPLNIPLARHQAIKEDFEAHFYGLGVSPMKADILASLHYANAYLSYSRAALSRGLRSHELNPRRSIAGFHVATYKLLSPNSYTMLHLSFIGLPPWLNSIETLADVSAVQEISKEHEKILRPLEEQFQEGGCLLHAYRDFLTGNQIEAFFEFCAGYGEYVIHALLKPDKIKIKQLSALQLDELFRRLAMTTRHTSGTEPLQNDRDPDDLTEFGIAAGRHPGFHRFANALRWSTSIPQRQNAKVKSRERTERALYEVRYGLGQSLRRKANSAQEFMEAITEFMLTYNAETDQVYENTSQERGANPSEYAQTHYRKRILPPDLDDMLNLIHVYGPRLVCNILVAYGSSSGGGGKDAEETRTDDAHTKQETQPLGATENTEE